MRGDALTQAAPQVLDTYRDVITPEGVLLQLPAAGPLPRALAWLIDLATRLSVLFVLSVPFMLLGGLGKGLYLTASFLLLWGYPIFLEARYGQTLGKRVLGLRVVAGDGAPVGWTAAIVRNLLRTVDMLPFGYATGLISSLVDAHGRRLGDLVADTLVVHVPPRARATPPAPIDGAEAPLHPLLSHEQAALLAFAERAPQLSPARRQELANLAEALTATTGPDSVKRLYRIGNWMQGRQ